MFVCLFVVIGGLGWGVGGFPVAWTTCWYTNSVSGKPSIVESLYNTDILNTNNRQPKARPWVWALQWRQNGRDRVSNHRRLGCLLNRLFRRRSKKTSKIRVTGLCEGNPPVTGGFPSQRAGHAEMFPFNVVIMIMRVFIIKFWPLFYLWHNCAQRNMMINKTVWCRDPNVCWDTDQMFRVGNFAPITII